MVRQLRPIEPDGGFDEASPTLRRAELEATTFATQRISRESRGPKGLALLAAAALASIAGVAALGPRPPVPEAPAVVAVAADPRPTASESPFYDVRGGWPPSRDSGFALSPVLLDRPALRGARITTASVQVNGVLRIKADRVRVSLQTLDLVTVDSASVRTANLDGGIRPVRAPTIDVELALPEPRPTGQQLWIVVSAYNAEGAPIGIVRRAVTVDPLQ